MKANKRRKSGKKKYVVIVLAVMLLGAGGYFGWTTFAGTDEDTSQPNANQQAAEENAKKYPNRIRLVASGDTVVHDSVNENAQQADGSYDYYPLMDEMAPLFAAADVRFCNQVTPAGGEELGVTGYPIFNAPTGLVRDLGKTGCNLVNMASNHSFDYSQEAISNNVAAWEEVPDVLAAAGQNRSAAERDAVHTFSVKGVEFAFLAYTTYLNNTSPAKNNYGVTQYSRELAETQINKAKADGADVIITSMRWGTEFATAPDGAQRSEAAFLADQGVDLILGHGPHVVQPIDRIEGTDGNETVVWYSLGNFLNTQLEAEALFGTLAVVDFNVQTKQIESLGHVPILSAYSWTADEAEREDLLARTDVEVYALDDVTPEIIANIQLDTTVAEQRTRLNQTLNQNEDVPLLSKSQYLD